VRVVIDTNVWLSGFASAAGSPANIVDAVLTGALTPVFSAETFAELEAVLHRVKIRKWLGLADKQAFDLLKQIELLSDFVVPAKTNLPAVRDAKDLPFLAAALARPRVAALITGDKDLLVLAEQSALLIATPAMFAEQLLGQ
jgi:putative PIN family toxin of toxin-antitoxin system